MSELSKKNYWALILGGSSGFGLAAATKLAEEGMNICIVHRDRRGAMEEIEKSFDIIKSKGVNCVTINTNALTEEGINSVLVLLQENLGTQGKIRLLLHSIAFGSLKPLSPLTGGSYLKDE